jgi:dienelactone hydrolase
MIRTNNHPQISQIVADEEGIDIRSSLRPLRNLCALCVKKLTNAFLNTAVRRVGLAVLALGCALVAGSSTFSAEPKPDSKSQPLAGTEPLTMEGDIASHLVAGVDKFLLRKIDESVAKREQHWKRDFSSADAYNKSIEPNRKRLADILGIRDARVKFDAPELVATTKQPALVGKGENYEIYAIRWPVLEDPDPNRSDVIVYGEGLLCVPTGDKKPIADVIAIPDADQTPEQIVGLAKGVKDDAQFGRLLAEAGCRVVVPVLISREVHQRNGRAAITNREFLYRGGFEVGRHLIGYEIQKVLAIVDWFDSDVRYKDATTSIGAIGFGEGGMIALIATALDTRVYGGYCSGYFGNQQRLWSQPIDRSVFALMSQFGDEQLAAMLGFRHCILEACGYPEFRVVGNGGSPGVLDAPNSLDAFKLGDKAGATLQGQPKGMFKVSAGSKGGEVDVKSILYFIDRLLKKPIPEQKAVELEYYETRTRLPSKVRDVSDDAAARQSRQIAEIDRHTQLVLRESPFVRDQYMKKLYDAANTKDLAAYEKVAEEYREKFYNDVIGKFDDPLLPANPRTRKVYDKEKWTGYEVVLDVFPDVIAYGVLLVPKDLKEGEKRPVVVCQHGLEGRPKHVIEGDEGAYHDYAAKLCERGFITFAPQNCYIFEDRFRSLQRKANPLGKTLFSVIVPQHQQITDWLKTLPFVDGERIGFYGLSYGGKSAMRIPPLVKNYCLSICSADFNEWVDKNASTRNPHSYVWSGEYEIFEWDLGSTFNYAEMAALIAPRPFMVERGHFDGVASDETVAHEFAKVRHHYAARMGIGDRCEIEWFVGPHTINGQGTFEFLHKHLKWPQE